MGLSQQSLNIIFGISLKSSIYFFLNFIIEPPSLNPMLDKSPYGNIVQAKDFLWT